LADCGLDVLRCPVVVFSNAAMSTSIKELLAIIIFAVVMGGAEGRSSTLDCCCRSIVVSDMISELFAHDVMNIATMKRIVSFIVVRVL